MPHAGVQRYAASHQQLTTQHLAPEQRHTFGLTCQCGSLRTLSMAPNLRRGGSNLQSRNYVFGFLDALSGSAQLNGSGPQCK